jgi:hypothetical protein
MFLQTNNVLPSVSRKPKGIKAKRTSKTGTGDRNTEMIKKIGG